MNAYAIINAETLEKLQADYDNQKIGDEKESSIKTEVDSPDLTVDQQPSSSIDAPLKSEDKKEDYPVKTTQNPTPINQASSQNQISTVASDTKTTAVKKKRSKLVPALSVGTKREKVTKNLKHQKLKNVLLTKKGFSSLHDIDLLIDDSLSRRKNTSIIGEKKFYNLLIKNNLDNLITNKFKLKKYNPDWYKI